ncbi:5980_t:CDS:2, partial [Funneliformis geosporum]
MTSMDFPPGYFYIKSSGSPSGASTSSPASQNLVVDVERGFFVSWGAIKDGTKTVVALQKNDVDHDPYQLWKYEDGWLVNKQTSLCLEAESGKVGNRLVLYHRKSPNQAANQRWKINKDGHIALQSHSKHVIDVKGSVKEGSYVVLADNGSKSFVKSNNAKWTLIALSKKKSRSGGAIGVIRLELVEAKDLKSVDSFLAGGKSDPYVRVFHEGGKDIIAQTKVIDNNLDPVWKEVHYLPVKNIGDKFVLDVMDFNTFTKDKPLGQYVFEVTKELVKEVGDDVYEGTPGIDVWAKLSIKGQIHYKAKFFPLTPLPEPSTDFLANLKEKPFDRLTLFTLITLQSPDGSFPPSNTLANLFGYADSDTMFKLYRANCHEERVLNINKTIWTTSMVLWFLRYLLKDFRSEWSGAYERAEQYISKEISGDLEIEEIVIASGRKAVRERFDIKTSDPQKTVITRESIKSADIHRIMKFQLKTNGAFQINDDLAKSLSFDNADQLRTALTVHINKHSKNTKITHLGTQVWVNILVLHFFRLVCVDHHSEWKDTYLRSYRWLWGQFKSRELIETEAFTVVRSYVKERYSVKEEAYELDTKFMAIISEEINSIKKGGFREVKFGGGIVPAKKLYGIARININKAKNLMQADSWFGGGASDPYLRITSVSTGWEYGETRIVYNTINPEWEQVFYIPIYDLSDKFKLQVYDYNAFFKHVLLGYYVLDLKDFIKVLGNGTIEGKHLDLDSNLTLKGSSKGKLQFTADFNSFSQAETESITTTTISKTTITIRHLYLLMTYQRQDGCFEITDNVASLFNFSSKDELLQAFTAHVQKDDHVKALHVDVWSSALITALLKALLWTHRREWNT